MSATTIKAKIKQYLDELKTAGTLREVIEDDLKKSILDRDIQSYPCAVLVSPAISSVTETNRQNNRSYTFEVVVIVRGENIQTVSEVETLCEAILDKFDNKPDMDGTATGGVEPATTAPAPVTSRGQSLVIFSVIIKANEIINLTF